MRSREGKNEIPLTKCDAEIENDRDEIPESESSVFPDVPEHDGAQDGGVQLEADLEQSILETFRLQDSALLLRVVLEHRVPSLQAEKIIN